MARLICEVLEAILDAIEVFEEDLQADDFEPGATDLVVCGALVAQVLDEPFLCFYRSCEVFCFELQF